MPHQCLNCGHVIPRGSDEILKGCSKCSGKKFMFTSQPMSEEARETLNRKADRVRNKMIKKADPELLKILKERGMTEIDGSSLEIDRSLGDDWVRYRPGSEDEIELDEGTSKTGIEIVEGVRKPSAKDLISELDSKKETDEETKERKTIKKKKRPVKKRSLPFKKVPQSPLRKKTDVDVINIIETGVYEIDVEKLLDDNPIIIQKDGSYLLHLPSLFKEGREKKK